MNISGRRIGNVVGGMAILALLLAADLKMTSGVSRRVEVSLNSAHSVLSGTDFTISSPSAGEHWTKGCYKTISWTPHVAYVNIYLSLDNGNTWQLIRYRYEPLNGDFLDWTVNKGPSTQCIIRVEDNQNTSNYGLSGTFVIDAKNVSVAYPSLTNIVWPIGSQKTILWDANTCGNVDIVLSRDGGVNYNETLVSNTANDGAFTWTVTGADSSMCRIMVVESPPQGMAPLAPGPDQAYDVSDNNFTICVAPTISLASATFSPTELATTQHCQ